MGKDKVEICTITVVFPIESDEQALTFKKQISELLNEVPNAQIQFRIMTPPAGLAAGM